MADELAGMVVHGPKRATAGLLADYERDHEPVPEEGDYAVVVDSRGLPVVVVRTARVEVKPLREVDASFARDEGQGDRSLAWWLDAHRRFFARRCEQLGVASPTSCSRCSNASSSSGLDRLILSPERGPASAMLRVGRVARCAE